jgi:alginate O-acetyltransferase complex protein AlgI
LLSGLWHGAAWNFVAWGAYHGFFLTVEKFYGLHGLRFPALGSIKQVLTFLCITTGWVLFRSESLDQAMKLWARMYGFNVTVEGTPIPFFLFFQSTDLAAVVIGLVIALVPLPQFVRNLAVIRDSILLDTLRWSTGIMLVILSVSGVLAFGSSSFLYFRF